MKSLIAFCLLAGSVALNAQQDEAPDGQAFIEALRDHIKNGTQRDFSEEFKKTIRRDCNGKIIKRISEDPDLNSVIFYNIDAVPDQFIELVLASWLEDDYQWGARGGFYYSPATGILEVLRRRIRPADVVESPEIKNLYFVVEDKETRIKMATVLRKCHSDKELSSEAIRERRAAAWSEIVGIVERSFPRLLKEDNERRSAAAKEMKSQPVQFLKKIKQKDP